MIFISTVCNVSTFNADFEVDVSESGSSDYSSPIQKLHLDVTPFTLDNWVEICSMYKKVGILGLQLLNSDHLIKEDLTNYVRVINL